MQIFNCKAYPELSTVAYTYENSHNWGHKATLLLNDSTELNKYKITYYNRTWESYEYQTVIKSVIYAYQQYIINEFIDDYKQEHAIKRLSHGLKTTLTNQAKQSDFYQKLETFYKEL